ncbi:MAG: HAD hydrolase family protein [Armatimonadetes bacterium]|nr:HAD hydrolase family protein [Armatimonadota bacterium]
MASLDPDLRRRLRSVRLLVFDVDGVLTDGRLILSSSGEESKRFHIRDGLGIVLAQKSGLHVALMSGRASAAVDRRAKELGIRSTLVVSNARDKGRAMKELKLRLDLPTQMVAFVGDDINDLPAFEEAGLAVAVADAAPEVAARAHLVTMARGGEGAAREIVEVLLREQGRWDEAVRNYLQFLREDPDGTHTPTPQ